MTELVHLSLVLLIVNIFPTVFRLWPPFFFLKQDRCLFFCTKKKNQMTSKSRIRFSDVSAGVAEMNALRYLFSYYLQKRPSPQRQRPLQPEVTSPSVLRPGAATPVNDSLGCKQSVGGLCPAPQRIRQVFRLPLSYLSWANEQTPWLPF